MDDRQNCSDVIHRNGLLSTEIKEGYACSGKGEVYEGQRTRQLENGIRGKALGQRLEKTENGTRILRAIVED